MEPCFNSIKTSLLHHQLIEKHQVLLTEGIFTTQPLALDLTRIVNLPLLSLEEEVMWLALWNLAFLIQLLPTILSFCSLSKKIQLVLVLMWKDGLATTTTPKLVFNQQLSKAWWTDWWKHKTQLLMTMMLQVSELVAFGLGGLDGSSSGIGAYSQSESIQLRF